MGYSVLYTTLDIDNKMTSGIWWGDTFTITQFIVTILLIFIVKCPQHNIKFKLVAYLFFV